MNFINSINNKNNEIITYKNDTLAIETQRDALIVSLLAQSITETDPNPKAFMDAYEELCKQGLIKNGNAIFWYSYVEKVMNKKDLFNSV